MDSKMRPNTKQNDSNIHLVIPTTRTGHLCYTSYHYKENEEESGLMAQYQFQEIRLDLNQHPRGATPSACFPYLNY